MPVFALSKHLAFPSPELATPDGLLAIGGDLSPERLLLAYSMGIFPWFGRNEPILWWSPDPRLVLFPGQLHVPRRLRRWIRNHPFQISNNRCFEEVMRSCAMIRRSGQQGTWITESMVQAYVRLHRQGRAHSVETWRQGELVGGLYGVAYGRCFFGESMFSRVPNASKAAFVSLAQHLYQADYRLIDCQIVTRHLQQFGARKMQRKQFLELLQNNCRPGGPNDPNDRTPPFPEIKAVSL